MHHLDECCPNSGAEAMLEKKRLQYQLTGYNKPRKTGVNIPIGTLSRLPPVNLGQSSGTDRRNGIESSRFNKSRAMITSTHELNDRDTGSSSGKGGHVEENTGVGIERTLTKMLLQGRKTSESYSDPSSSDGDGKSLDSEDEVANLARSSVKGGVIARGEAQKKGTTPYSIKEIYKGISSNNG
jgi:hypothetical protein